MKVLKITKPTENITLLKQLARLGIIVSADCAGLGTCGKCKVKVISGEFENVSTNKPYLPDKDGFILSCKALLKSEEAVIEVQGDLCTDNAFIKGKTENLSAKNLGLALDIGTTTLCAALVDLDTGDILEKISELNPQKNFGADVISRITASKENLDSLQSVLLVAVNRMILKLTENFENKSLQKMTVTGNPTMLHLFCGVSPEKMGVHPFTPEFLDLKILDGNDLDLSVGKIYLLPSSSAFIGSDITAAVLYLKMTEQKKPCLLIDVGTNGEMVLFSGSDNGSKLFATSSAAGPAMEGVGIACGVGGITGAISHVENKDNSISFATVNNGSPIGICTSGLIDLIAVLLSKDILDETGYLECEQFNLHNDENATVFINQEDIRTIQLAKSAIRAALDTLLFENGFDYSDIDTLYLAGGIGYYLSPLSAAKIGLFPEAVIDKVKAVGNTSLLGAVNCLLNEDKIAELSKLCENINTINLNESKTFNNAFVEHMYF